MKLYGLIGYPLTHSFSKGYFTEKFAKENLQDHAYLNFPIKDIAELNQVTESNPDLLGFNVTIPYKEQIIPYLDYISSDAMAVGAVNTVRVSKIKGETRLTGHNTDVDGFRESLVRILRADVKSSLILGTGGASKAVAYVLKELGIKINFVSRKEKEGNYCYNDLDRSIVESNLLIVNTSPLGTFPEINTFPAIPYPFLNSKHILFDLVYNPPETVFLREGKKRGALIKNGLDMLYRQAEQAWQIWNHPELYKTLAVKQKIK
jgi:shikimate dehydrogenase